MTNQSYIKNYILIAVLFFLTSCLTQNKIEKSGINTIEFGSSGGFTGKKLAYSLDLKEKILLSPSKEEIKVKTGDIKEILKLLSAIDLTTINLNEPGNMNEFLEIDGNQKMNLIWEKNASIPSEIKTLYDKLQTLTSDEKK